MSLKNKKRSGFPNADPMDEKTESQLIMRVFAFSFTYGLLRVSKINMSTNRFFLLYGVFHMTTMIGSDELSNFLFGASVIWYIYMAGALLLLFKILYSKTPEADINSQLFSLIFQAKK